MANKARHVCERRRDGGAAVSCENAGWRTFSTACLEPFPVLSVVLLLGVGDPIIPFDALRIGIKLFRDLLDIFWFPTSNLDKGAGTHLIESVSKGRADSINLFEIVCLNVLTDLGRSSLGSQLGSILAGRTRRCGC